MSWYYATVDWTIIFMIIIAILKFRFSWIVRRYRVVLPLKVNHFHYILHITIFFVNLQVNRISQTCPVVTFDANQNLEDLRLQILDKKQYIPGITEFEPMWISI